MQEEIWEDIPNYEGMYQVSNLGRVKSLDRRVKHSRSKDKFFIKKGFVLKAYRNKKYYVTVILSKNGTQKSFNMHSLVAKVFIDSNYIEKGLVVDHIDNNKLNNNILNLRLVTQRDNTSRRQKKKPAKSKYVGAHYNKRDDKWRSAIYIKGKIYHLGTFETEEDAAKAYRNKLEQLKTN